MKKSNFVLEGLDSTLFCTGKSKFQLFFQVILIFFNLHEQSLEKLQETPKHRPSEAINIRERKRKEKKKRKQLSFMLYCSERVFYTAWGEKRKKKKQTKTNKNCYTSQRYSRKNLNCYVRPFAFLSSGKIQVIYIFKQLPFASIRKLKTM